MLDQNTIKINKEKNNDHRCAVNEQRGNMLTLNKREPEWNETFHTTLSELVLNHTRSF
jgi:hypothetical protein